MQGGGVGTAAVQFARAQGLTVIGTAGTQRGLELVKKEGAHHVFDHTKAGYAEEIQRVTGGKGVDVILEILANVNLATDLKLLALHGRVIVIGNRGVPTHTLWPFPISSPTRHHPEVRAPELAREAMPRDRLRCSRA